MDLVIQEVFSHLNDPMILFVAALIYPLHSAVANSTLREKLYEQKAHTGIISSLPLFIGPFCQIKLVSTTINPPPVLKEL